jgi:NADPH:quinone reductase-like Zn-dependent oxidoreductase
MPATSALWITGPGAVAFRDAPLPPAGEGDVLVEAAWSGISLGIEALVLRGGVPVSERRRMRAPFQAGDFPWPVRYGYAAVGRVVDGRPATPAAPSSCSIPIRTASRLPRRWWCRSRRR